MKSILLSSLTKVFKDVEPNFDEFTEFSVLRGEIFNFQIAIFPQTDEDCNITVEVASNLRDGIKVYKVLNVPSTYAAPEDHDDFHYDTKRTEYPDLLQPINEDNTVELVKGEWNCLWFKYTPEMDYIAGTNGITVFLKKGLYDENNKHIFNLRTIPRQLPMQDLIYTNWFHNDCLCTHYKVEPFSDEYWTLLRNYVKNAVAHGVNMIYTPIFTPPLDTEVGGERPTFQLVEVDKIDVGYRFSFRNFDKYVRICTECGIKYFEISHFFTQWGAKHAPKIMANVKGIQRQIFGWDTVANGKDYVQFLAVFAKAFTKEVERLDIKQNCYLHVSDEPNNEQIEDYKNASYIINQLFPDFHIIDALSEIEIYRQGLVKTPICGEDVADIFKAEVKDFWTYYCCCETHDFLPNRMFAMPPTRNRILGMLLYKYEAKGFLQWGHNFWYTQYSKKHINPFEVTDAGGAFPSGDSFVVDPGPYMQPLNSTRHEVFYEGICDYRAMKYLERLTSREHVLKILTKNLDTELTFKNYPHDIEWLLNKRAEINKEIELAIR